MMKSEKIKKYRKKLNKSIVQEKLEAYNNIKDIIFGKKMIEVNPWSDTPYEKDVLDTIYFLMMDVDGKIKRHSNKFNYRIKQLENNKL